MTHHEGLPESERRTHPPRLPLPLRLVLGVSAVALVPVALFVAFVGTVVFHDCLIKCIPEHQDPSPVIGSLIFVGAGMAVALAGMLGTLGVTGRGHLARPAAVVSAAVAGLLVVVTIATQVPQLP